MTFVVSHLVCCNIRRTVGSLWSSCVISRRVTHLEPSYRADKLLLCLGHLEGWSHSLHWTPYTTQSFPEWKRYVTWSWIFDKLTYTVGTIQSVTEPWKFGSNSKKMYDAVWPILQRFYKTAKVFCKDQAIKGEVLSHYLNENYFFSSWFNLVMFKRGLA